MQIYRVLLSESELVWRGVVTIQKMMERFVQELRRSACAVICGNP